MNRRNIFLAIAALNKIAYEGASKPVGFYVDDEGDLEATLSSLNEEQLLDFARNCLNDTEDQQGEQEDDFEIEESPQRSIPGICDSCGRLRTKTRDYDHGCGNVCSMCS